MKIHTYTGIRTNIPSASFVLKRESGKQLLIVALLHSAEKIVKYLDKHQLFTKEFYEYLDKHAQFDTLSLNQVLLPNISFFVILYINYN
jgi:hypothetical protein